MQLPVTWDPFDVDLDEPPPLSLSLRAADERPPTVAAAIEEILERGARHGRDLGPGYQRLWAELSAATADGKRLRPALFETGYRAWGGTDHRAGSVIAAAIELLHTAFVVHDDVIDGDDRRRGRLNVSGAHAADARARGADEGRAREFGVAAGILAGDLALTAALRAVATCPAPSGTVHRLLDLFDAALHATAAGELADVRLSLDLGAVTVEEALTMAERKTAIYSFALPLQAAAVLADVPEDAVVAAGAVGRLLGTSFQLVDDLLGVFGDPAETGKSALSDLRAGKQTSLIVHARATAAWPELSRHVGNPSITEADGARARALLDACGSHDFVRGLATRHARDALSLGTAAGMPPALVSWLHATTNELLERAA
jgi:geranylgeranyl diphosphate synthase, type II